jgi:hypothetical protein
MMRTSDDASARTSFRGLIGRTSVRRWRIGRSTPSSETCTSSGSSAPWTSSVSQPRSLSPRSAIRTWVDGPPTLSRVMIRSTRGRTGPLPRSPLISEPLISGRSPAHSLALGQLLVQSRELGHHAVHAENSSRSLAGGGAESARRRRIRGQPQRERPRKPPRRRPARADRSRRPRPLRPCPRPESRRSAMRRPRPRSPRWGALGLRGMGEDVEGAIQPPGVELAAVESDDVGQPQLGHERLEHRPVRPSPTRRGAARGSCVANSRRSARTSSSSPFRACSWRRCRRSDHRVRNPSRLGSPPAPAAPSEAG